MIIHTVKSGETVYNIANQYEVSLERLISDNQIIPPYKLVVGQSLVILFPEITHVVNRGETIYSISELYGISAIDILRNNPHLISSGQIQFGQEIVIKYKNNKIGDIIVNGYAYPFIADDILRESLTYLSKILIFSYGFTSDGNLIPLNDEKLLLTSKEYNVAPILVLTTLDESGKFNSYILTQIIKNPAAKNNLIQNILKTVKTKGYSGVDIDFEFIQASDKNGYINFVSQLTNTMNSEGYTVSVALVPKTSGNQPGLLYEGIDYKQLGQAANSVLLMTYEWGHTRSSPMAVAPINKVKEVLDYAVTQIPREKIDMGIPNYGYDWALPYVEGETEAEVVGNLEAMRTALEFNAQIKFDTIAMSPYFEYKYENISHIVWFEDARSIDAKLRTVSEYELRGVGYWTVMKYFRQNWLILNNLFNIEK